MPNSLVYFCENATGDMIRIGFTGQEDPNRRIGTHLNYGYRLRAVVPAFQQDEYRLHKHFSESRMAVGTDKSTYAAEAVNPYIEWLLNFHFAVEDIETGVQYDRAPWRNWSPEAMARHPLLDHNEQYCFFPTAGVVAGERDCWQTPQEVIELCREALGGVIDVDPCSEVEANKRVQARYFFTGGVRGLNGLVMPWHGNVYLNPPYESAGGAEEWVEKLVAEIRLGNAEQAIALLNLQSMPTLWFPTVWNAASSFAVFKQRIAFHGPGGIAGKDRYSSSQNGSIFCYFGSHGDRFKRVFSGYAMVFDRWRDPLASLSNEAANNGGRGDYEYSV